MHVVLTGATGLVGGGVLHYLLSMTPAIASAQHISRLSILSRKPDIPLLSHPKRPVENTHTKIDVIPHSDFTTYPPSLLSQLKSSPESPNTPDSVAVIWALGMSQNDAKSPEQYVEVTKTYPVNAAKAFAAAFSPAPVNFVFVSGEGATHAPGAFTPLFGKVKGEAVQELLALAASPEYQNLRVYNVRPAAVDPGAPQDGQPLVNELWLERLKGTEPWGKKVARMAIVPALRAGMIKWFHSPTGELARFLVGLGVGDGRPLTGDGVENDGWTVRNAGLRRLVKDMA